MNRSYPKNHTKFILSPLTKIMVDVTSASAGIGDGMETYPTYDYLMQSVFLKMTGAQEQKMKCICWELATYDYEYRDYRYRKTPLGQCSTFKEKQYIYRDLFKQIRKYDNPQFSPSSNNKTDILNITTSVIADTFSTSNLVISSQKSFIEYISIWNGIDERFFMGNHNDMFPSIAGSYSLKDIYENHLYKKRNRIAHNTKSYQQNLPTLKTLVDDKYKYDNYFLYFAILILIDNIFIHLYKEYLSLIEGI